MTLVFGRREFLISSEGYTNIPATALFIFNEKSLKLENIKFYSLDQGLTPSTLGKELLKNKEKIVLVISRAKYLPGFTSQENNPEEHVYYLGKPGSDIYSWGILLEDLTFPYEIIQELQKSKLEQEIIRYRENLLKTIENRRNAKTAG